MRAVTIVFQKRMAIQVGTHPVWKSKSESIDILDLGIVDWKDKTGKNRPHMCGIIVQSVRNHLLLMKNIKSLEGQSADDRIKWFEKSMPSATIVKIELSKLTDRFKNNIPDKALASVISQQSIGQ